MTYSWHQAQDWVPPDFCRKAHIWLRGCLLYLRVLTGPEHRVLLVFIWLKCNDVRNICYFKGKRHALAEFQNVTLIFRLTPKLWMHPLAGVCKRCFSLQNVLCLCDGYKNFRLNFWSVNELCDCSSLWLCILESQVTCLVSAWQRADSSGSVLCDILVGVGVG